MNILYLGPVPPHRGGIAQHGERLVEGLLDEGHSVEVISWRAQYPPILYKGVSVRPDGSEFVLSWWNPLRTWRSGRKARQFDLVVIPWVGPFQAFHYQVLLWALGGRASVVAVVHNVMPHERFPLGERLTRRLLGRANGWVVHAQAVADDLKSVVQHAEPVIVVMPANLSLSPAPLPPFPPYRLLFFGTVRAYKGAHIALEATEILRMRGRDVHLTVAGEFWVSVKDFQMECESRGLADAVDIVAGYVPDAAVDRLFADHHMLVAPYEDASQSGVVPLALAAGRPAAVTDVGGVAELVTEGETGAIAAGPNAGEVAAAVERIIGWLGSPRARSDVAPGSWRAVANAVVEAGR